ncbi:MAG: hydrolase [Verrucomicrobia bacterium]|nr:hydrolase [Verrucomicrobiota bacterium]MBV9673551.1 hydrolase [Verrucomicrobiota bacterium]
MVKRILVFGDSNSWGWIPRHDIQPTLRYDKSVRWPGVLGSLLGPDFEILEEALSARTTNLDDPREDLPSEYLRGATLNGAKIFPAILASHLPLDLVIIMLGTNDLKTRFDRTPGEIAQAALSLARMVKECEGGVFTQYSSPQVLLLAPPALGSKFHDPTIWIGAREKSLMLGAVMKDAARAANVPVFDTSEVTEIDGIDSVHLSAIAHRAIAEAVKPLVTKLIGSTNG